MTTRYCVLAVALAATLAGEPGRRVLIGPDDSVTIFALNVDEISKVWRVAASGELNLPMVGRIKAAGLSVGALEHEIAERLRKFVVDPQVTVWVSESRSYPVTMNGAVEKPGVLQLPGPTQLYMAILQAGGLKDAGPTLTLTRESARGAIPHPGVKLTPDGKYGVVELTTADVMSGRGEGAELLVQAWDLVTIPPEKHQRMVYISGEVNRPGAVELVTQDSISISKVVALAGGLTRTASPGRTVIRHINANGVETAFNFINLKKIMAGKAADLQLSEGDIVVVPSNQFLGYLQTASTAAITTGIYVLGRY